jgi:deoxyribodipyrimidine photo-lyase
LRRSRPARSQRHLETVAAFALRRDQPASGLARRALCRVRAPAAGRRYRQIPQRTRLARVLPTFVDVPDLSTRNLQASFDAFPWRHNTKGLWAWQRGRTGYPIVDAGMRELWHTGVMHNRVRMVAASFLVKYLLIDWREGEKWFWDTLVDADAGSSPANWQWVAGSSADAAPYFRVFNPTLQGEKFDPDSVYVRRWVPGLAQLRAGLIHQPWTATPLELAGAGVELGKTYPYPIADHRTGRERALAAYAGIRNASMTSV